MARVIVLLALAVAGCVHTAHAQVPRPTAPAAAAPQSVFDKAETRTAREPAPRENAWLWQSVSATQQTIPRDLATLYETLHRASALPTTEYLDAKGQSIQSILLERKLIFGDYFPIEIDRVLCELNSRVCKMVGGEKAVWSNKASDTLKLPALHFETVRVMQGYEKKSGEKVESIVRIREGCETYDPTCWKLVENLNSETLEEMNRRAGTVIIPALTVQTTLQGPLPIDVRARLASNLIVTAEFKRQSGVSAEPRFQEQRTLFGLINHPFAMDGGDVPNGEPIHVGVIDESFGSGLASHCEFGGSVDDPGCGVNNGESGVSADHGLHVAGIIGARVNGRGVAGLSPGAIMHTGVYVAGLPGNTGKLAQAISRLRGENVDVINLSFGYKPLASALEDPADAAIRLVQNTLFVAAAGNDGHDMANSVCDQRPACLSRSLDNVIGVVALEGTADDPKLWDEGDGQHKSNWGRVFDLAAPGKNILSTLADGSVGIMSGTSQAAPMVASAAALLLTLDDKLRPIQIKRRLIATSDLIPSLSDVALGGRLNVRRAIEDKDSDVLRMFDGRIIKGKLAKTAHSIDVLRDNGEPDVLSTQKILRWSCTETFSDCTFIFISNENKLAKWVNTAVVAGGPKLSVVVPGAGVKTFNVTDVKDFTAAIRE